MDTRVAFEPNPGYLRVTVHGAYPSTSYPDLLRSILDEASKIGATRILIDCLGLPAPPSEMARFNLGVEIAALFGGRFRIAILYRRDLINKFTEDAAVNRGANLRVTSEETDAVEWLLAETGQ
jgi:hypothetical protein